VTNHRERLGPQASPNTQKQPPKHRLHKLWMYTSEVTSLGKKSYGGHKYSSYRVYQTKGDLKAASSFGLSVAGTLAGGKWGAVAASFIGSFHHPKHGLATTIIWIPNKANVITSMTKWK